MSKDIVFQFINALNKQDLFLIIENDEFSVIIGKASASYKGNREKYWEFPAWWKVAVKNNQIQVWQVFCDSKKQLDSMK